MLTVLENPSSSHTMATDFMLVEFQSTNLPEIALALKAPLALKALGPHAIFADHMDKCPVVSGAGRPAILEVKLVVLICFYCTDVAGRFTGAGENASGFDFPGLVYVALIISQKSIQPVKAAAVEKHNLLLRLSGLIGVTY
jgi:hypothetical protein